MTKDEALRLALKALKSIDEAMPFPVAKLAIKECKAALEANEFNPDWDTQAVLTEEIQRMAKRIEELEAKDEPVAIYGYCPTCNAKGVSRERHPDGSDRCTNGHTYKSKDALTTSPQRKPLTEIALLGAYEEEQQGRWGDHVRGLRAIEAAHGIKGEA
jgi:hypothetical protein